MRIQVSQLFNSFYKQNILLDMSGPDTIITRIDPVKNGVSSSLVFVDSIHLLDEAIQLKPAAIITDAKLAKKMSSLTDTAILTSNNVRLANALIRQTYADHNHRNIEWDQIHPSAVIHDSVNLGDDIIIGPGVVIGQNSSIGNSTIIKANSVIEQNVTIGEDCILHPNVVISSDSELGNRVIIKSGCVVGMEGFGFAQDGKGKSYRIPQTGRVIIEDDVLFGANCTIDRATYEITRIGSGSKFDALCHIGHNVEIGEDCIMVTQSSIGGSTTLGKRVIISGQCVITDHVNVCDDVTLVQRAGVINDIKKPGIFAGMPIQPLKEYFKNIAVVHKLANMRNQFRKLEKRLDATKDSLKN